MSPSKPQFIASVSGAGRLDVLAGVLQALEEVDYDGLEIQNNAFDRWIDYPVLTNLNKARRPHREHLDGLRRLLAPLRARGRRVGLWTHELWCEADIPALYPELRTPRGDINLSHPLLAEFVRARLDHFLKAAPEFDYLVLSLTETTWPVMQRFDNAMTPLECTRWMLGLYADVCRARGVELVVRPFSANRTDYRVVREALRAFPALPVMLKSEPFDWNPFLPLNPYFADYPDHPRVMEFDISAEYYGCNELPAAALEYVRERLEYGERMGVQRFVARIERYGRLTLRSVNRPLGLYAARFFGLADRDPGAFLRGYARGEYANAPDPDGVARLLEQSFDLIKHIFYVDGQLLFHGLYASLSGAINALCFETIRPNHSLAHAAREWALLSERTTPSAETIRAEKEQALAEARRMAAEARRCAPDARELIDACDNTALIADIYLHITLVVQAYLEQIDRPGGSVAAQAQALKESARRLAAARGADWMGQRTRGGFPVAVERFAEELSETFEIERALRARCAGFEDVILCGFPNEGHNPSKTTHGARAFFEDGRWQRQVTNDTLGYESSVSPGRKRVSIEVRGHGRFRANEKTVEFQQADWTTLELLVDAPDGVLRFTLERLGTPAPAVRMIGVTCCR